MSRKFSDVDIALPISVELRARRFPAEKNLSACVGRRKGRRAGLLCVGGWGKENKHTTLSLTPPPCPTLDESVRSKYSFLQRALGRSSSGQVEDRGSE